MNADDTVRRCPACRAVSYPTNGHRDAVHFVGCSNPRPPEAWMAVPELDRRYAMGHACWRALHSVWIDSLRFMPQGNRDRLPERLHRPTCLQLQDAVLDGCLQVDLVVPEHLPAYLALTVDTGEGVESLQVPLEWIGADLDALLLEESIRMHLALAAIRDGEP